MSSVKLSTTSYVSAGGSYHQRPFGVFLAAHIVEILAASSLILTASRRHVLGKESRFAKTERGKFAPRG